MVEKINSPFNIAIKWGIAHVQAPMWLLCQAARSAKKMVACRMGIASSWIIPRCKGYHHKRNIRPIECRLFLGSQVIHFPRWWGWPISKETLWKHQWLVIFCLNKRGNHEIKRRFTDQSPTKVSYPKPPDEMSKWFKPCRHRCRVHVAHTSDERNCVTIFKSFLVPGSALKANTREIIGRATRIRTKNDNNNLLQSIS